MKKRKANKRKHRPTRYLKYKGRFGECLLGLKKVEENHIEIPKHVSLSPDSNAHRLIETLDASMKEPERFVDFKKVEVITIRGGLVLRAYRDEFFTYNGFYPKIVPPKNKKIRAVLQFLGYGDYGMDCSQYGDIACWDIRSWDADEDFRETSFPKLIMEEIIPKCCGKKLDDVSSDLATAIAEAINNSSEHAYKGKKESSKFRKWYLGCGEYPRSGRITFCVYDRGQGFKDSMTTEGSFWNILKPLEGDYKYIERATRGTSGTKVAGRGKGLKTAVSKLQKANGIVEILSGKGLFSTDERVVSRDRKTVIDGSIIAFYLPAKYIGGDDEYGRKDTEDN